MTPSDWLGTLAGFCTTIAFLPQVLKVWRSRSARDISLVMYAVFTFGVGCWLVYGWMLMIWPIIIANIVTLVLVAAVIAMKLRWG
jgi:MtN3 and saliva related transmembrane protein